MKTQEDTNMHTVHDLDDLITEYLADGIITAKERAVLLRKAEQLGIDRDEADLYIDAQQQKADQKVDAAVSRKRGATCPYCGGSIPQLTDKCPHCGQNITAEASEELQEIFEHLEDALAYLKRGVLVPKHKAEVERYIRKAKMYYENNPKVKRMLDEAEKEVAIAVEKEKIELEEEKIAAEKENRKRKIMKMIGVFCFIIYICIMGGMLYQCHSENVEEEQKEKEEQAKEEQEASQTLENVQKTAEVVSSCLDKKDLERAARALTLCPVSELTRFNKSKKKDDAIALYTSLISNVVDAYLDKGQKKKAQDLVILCSAKYIDRRAGISDLFKKLGSDNGWHFKGEEGYENN